ncbi:glycoside hydrolase family 16 protein [Amycolatopsis sacchari]|uniref:glycoside hydrolase family 16 protein n=1 Tax=Amycolatopsis sacchari TaxID=115433 RepID=UPI003EBAB581
MKRRTTPLILCAVLIVAAVAAFVLTTQRFGSDDSGERAEQGSPGVAGAPPPQPASTEAAVLNGWQLVAGDDFNGTKIDTKRWDVYDGANSVGETWSRKQCTVSGGVLTLAGRADDAGTTCGLSWKGDQTFGRWEVRARLPVPADANYAPTFLLWGADDLNFPEAGEIDFSETWNPERQFAESWLHGPGNLKGPYIKSNPVDLTQWHNFGVDWQADKITLYLDGQVWGVYDDPKYIPRTPMHLVLQLSFVRKHPGTPVATSAQVDWARVYR